MAARVIPEGVSPFAFETVTVSDSAAVLTAATWRPAAGGGDARYALLTPDAAEMRYRVDGTNPTATVGHLTADGVDIVLTLGEICQFAAIRDDAVDVNLSVTYYR